MFFLSKSSVFVLFHILSVRNLFAMFSLLRVCVARSEIPSTLRVVNRRGLAASFIADRRSSRSLPSMKRHHQCNEPIHFLHYGKKIKPFLFRRNSFFSSAKASKLDGDGGENESYFADPSIDFASLGIKSPVLLDRIKALGLTRPTAVQAAAYEAISSGEGDVTVGAETGSGKTLAYLLPLIDDVLQRKSKITDSADIGYDYARAIILVPNKELVQQVVRMAMSLCGGKESLVYGASTIDIASLRLNHDDQQVSRNEVVRLAIMPGGLKEPLDFQPFRSCRGLGGKDDAIDIVITTPAAVGPLALKPTNIDMFAEIATLVVDEADMLLDGGYIRALENVLMGFRRADRLLGGNTYNNVKASDDDDNESYDNFGITKTQHVFVAATLPDSGLRSVDAFLLKKFPYATRVAVQGMHNAKHSGLRESTIWVQEDNKKGRMKQLLDLLNTPTSIKEEKTGSAGLKGEKVMVFLNSVDDVEGATQALVRAGVNAQAYHAKIPLSERTLTLDRFRRYVSPTVGTESDIESDSVDDDSGDKGSDTVPVLICTDLASRGLDIPGVGAVVQLQFAGNVVAHLHRMGRCGRAGMRTGRGIVMFGEKERDLVEVVRQAERQQERMNLKGNDVILFDEDEGGEPAAVDGSVKNAFSRKRGFTKKRKKERREAREDAPSE